jgi:hypothetical protein
VYIFDYILTFVDANHFETDNTTDEIAEALEQKISALTLYNRIKTTLKGYLANWVVDTIEKDKKE